MLGLEHRSLKPNFGVYHEVTQRTDSNDLPGLDSKLAIDVNIDGLAPVVYVCVD